MFQISSRDQCIKAGCHGTNIDEEHQVKNDVTFDVRQDHPMTDVDTSDTVRDQSITDLDTSERKQDDPMPESPDKYNNTQTAL